MPTRRSKARLGGAPARVARWLALTGATGTLSTCATEWRDLPPVDAAAFRAEHDAWRDWRRGRLLASGSGPLLWIGLWELPEGVTEFGADSMLPIVLPRAQSPLLAGRLVRHDARIRLEPAPGVAFRLVRVDSTPDGPPAFRDGGPISQPLEMRSDADTAPNAVWLGSLGLRIHEEPRGRFWLRVWDEEHESRRAFDGADFYPPDPRWRVAARFEPFRQPRTFQVVDVTGALQEYAAPGRLRFRVDGRDHRLTVFAGTGDTRFWILFGDSTNVTETYPGGRYLLAPLPDGTGWTELDFNRAYSPPCAFTPFSTCALPPAENRLALPVIAGELAPH